MKINNNVKIYLATVGALALMSGSVFAGNSCKCGATSSRQMHDQGTIRNIESKDAKLVMVDRHDAVLNLKWDQNTRFLMHNKVIQPSDLKAGERIEARYMEMNHGLVATTIRVLPEHASVSFPYHSREAYYGSTS